MKIVQQITPWTCSLACIESICFDLGIKNASQQELIESFGDILMKNCQGRQEHLGIASPATVRFILKQLGFSVVDKKCHPQINVPILQAIDLSQEVSLVQGNIEKEGNHCTRFAGLEGENVVRLMNPKIEGADICKYTIEELNAWTGGWCSVDVFKR
jgi:hypothetical protein